MKYLMTIMVFAICFQSIAIHHNPLLKSEGYKNLTPQQKEKVLYYLSQGNSQLFALSGNSGKKNLAMRMDSSVYLEYTDASLQFKESQYYNYNSDGILTDYSMIFNANGNMDSSHVKYHLNANNVVTSILNYGINENDVWGILDSIAREYNQNGQITKQSIFEYNGFSYSLMYEQEITYNSELKLLSEAYKFDLGAGLQNLFKMTYTYNEKGKTSIITSSTWDGGAEKFIEDDKVLFVYQGNILDTTNHLEFNVNKWEVYSFDTYKWDGAKLLQSTSYYKDNDKWINDYKMTFQYEKDIPVDAVKEVDLTTNLFPLYYFGAKYLATQSKSEMWVDNQWEVDDEEYYFYSEKEVSSVPIVGEMETNLFPNPVSHSLQVNSELFGKVEVLNALGQIVYSIDKKEEAIKIDVAKWNSGLYTLTITQGAVVASQKFIVR